MTGSCYNEERLGNPGKRQKLRAQRLIFRFFRIFRAVLMISVVCLAKGYGMVFSDLFFLYGFLPVLLFLYAVCAKETPRRWVLTLASLLFYAWGNLKHLFVMLALVIADYVFGLLIDPERERSPRFRKGVLILAVSSNLALLAFFKYIGFFAETVNLLTGAALPVFRPLMPVGISFFTFQTLTYVVDVYRGDAKTQRSFGRLLLYVTMFPQLIAGPIVRYRDIEAQLEARTVTAEGLNRGILRFAAGLGKKVLIADCCGSVVASLNGLADVTTLARLSSALAFTLQLYFDFSGYSDMAIGLGAMFGFTFPENFRYPLAASSATDFWRRWHITLGSFFRDYVYIPLGGGRKHRARNILIVWFLTGLWHGASWNFVLWGLYYALILTLEKAFLLKWFDKLPKAVFFVLTRLYTDVIAVFGFAIFYFDADLIKNIGYLFGAGCTGFSDLYTMSILSDNLFLLAAAAILAFPVVPALGRAFVRLSDGEKHEKPRYIAGRVCGTLVSILLIAASTVRLVGGTYSPFLYFRF